MKNIGWIVILAVVAMAGCQQQTVQEARIEANKRWVHTRASLQYGLAVEHLKSGQLDKAKAKAIEALSLEEDYFDARVLLARVCIEEGHNAAAAGELRKALVLKPQHAESHYLLGVSQERDGQFAEALASYRKSYALDSTNVAAIVAAGEVLVALGQISDAQSHVESYLHVAGEDPAMLELAGRLAIMQRQFDKATRYYQQALDLDFRNGLYKESLARAHFLAGNYAEAADLLKELIDTPDRPVTSTTRTILADCYMASGRLDDARDQYQIVTDSRPDDAGAWLNLAKAALKLGDADRAAISARRSLDLKKKDLQATLVLGMALLKQEQNDEAIGLLTQARVTHTDATLVCLLGKAYLAAGKETDAVGCFRDAVKLDPENVVARELLNWASVKKVSMAD